MTPLMNDLLRCLRFESRKLLRRNLFWMSLAAVPLTVVLSGWAATTLTEPVESYALFAEVASWGILLAAFFLLVLGCSSVNEEATSGALRAVLCRPVSPAIYLLAKSLLLAAATLVLAALALLAAYLWTLKAGGFHGVFIVIPGLEDTEVYSASAMRHYATGLAFASVAPLFFSSGLGLLVSVAVDSSGLAVVLGLLISAGLGGLGSVQTELGPFCPPALLTQPMELLGELARANEAVQPRVEGWTLSSSSVWGPPLATLVITLVAMVTFSKRPVR